MEETAVLSEKLEVLDAEDDELLEQEESDEEDELLDELEIL